MSDHEKAFRDAGILRDSGWWTICAAERCDCSASFDLLHSPSDDPASCWVPVCAGHWRAICRGARLEYIIEVHGFVGGDA